MIRTSCIVFFFFSFWAICWTGGVAQTVEARVTLAADRLQPEDQELLSEIPQNLESYVNAYDWTGENKEILIRCGINFVVETVITRNAEKIYRVQFLINSRGGENYVDRACEFPYQKGQPMEHQRGQFSPLLALVDYYVYMVIAGELDTYILRGGTSYYNRARNITAEGQVSNYATGWAARQEQVERITDAEHAALREAKFYFYEGLFYVEARQDARQAPNYAEKVVELLETVNRRRPNSPALKRFLDAHYQEFCTLFTYDDNRRNLVKMMNIDNRRREVYMDCQLQSSEGRTVEP